MKRILLVAMGVVMVIVVAGGAFAATVGVTASVQKKCTAVSDGLFTAFNIDPDSPAISKTTALDGTSPALRCTKGTPVAVTCSPVVGNTGVLTMAGDTGGDITYTVTSCPTIPFANGYGTDNPINVGINIAAGAAANSAAGDHTGTITVTVTY